ncbi:patatin-like phospholipase family protein [Adlercreutzia caecimuris]|uniref:patatin-like phospholipase family protein n=1 Tax=Adlercreutzia caecimuris TaxID=671266 RepID=UPI002495A6F5|nr:patatin family protein [Adlercreutzia caecimuris]
MPIADQVSLAINQPDVALIFEGGGMRNSYTAPVVVELLARNINFGRVYGISAGSSHTVNYLVRDAVRARASFVELVQYPRFGGWKSLLAGHGYFNGPYLYEELIETAPADDPMRFDWDTFRANPADVHIEAMDWDTGETVAFTKADMREARDVGLMVRASSTMPIFMPPTTIGSRTYVDGGMGDSWGILLNAARADGFTRFCIIRTQPRGYRKKPMGSLEQRLFRAAFRKHPVVAERTIARWQPYNELCDEIERLEKTGAAWVFYPDAMEVTNKTTDYDALVRSYEAGQAQARRDIESLEAWLG